MELIDHLYKRLLLQAREAHGDPFGRTFEIAEIYQDLLPYRLVRTELGLLEFAAYEHTLLRLLSGERGYVQVQPAEVREEFRRELASPNPILGIYRDFASAQARLHRPVGARPATAPASAPLPDRVGSAHSPFAPPPPAPAPPPRREPEPPAPVRGNSGGPSSGNAAEDSLPPLTETFPPPREGRATAGTEAAELKEPGEIPVVRSAAPAARMAAPAPVPTATAEDANPAGSAPVREPIAKAAEGDPAPSAGAPSPASPNAPEAPDHCAICDGTLPRGRQVRFCPHCGGEQPAAPCGRCGAEMEHGWRFCASCGTPRASLE